MTNIRLGLVSVLQAPTNLPWSVAVPPLPVPSCFTLEYLAVGAACAQPNSSRLNPGGVRDFSSIDRFRSSSK